MKTEYTVTPAGIPLTFECDPSAQTVAVEVGFRAGSAYQGEIPGAAHFLEHCLFNGSVNYPSKQQIRLLIDELGAGYNGLTSREWVKYFFHCLPDKRNQASEWLNELVCRPVFNEDTMIAERGVITNELARRENESSFAFWKVVQYCFFGQHPYSTPVLGTSESINAMPPEYLRSLYRRLYVKQNAQVAIVGPIPKDQMVTMADSMFGELPDGMEQPIVEDPCIWEPQRLQAEATGLSQDFFRIGFPCFGWENSQYHALNLIGVWLAGSGMPLHRRLRDELGWIYGLGGGPDLERGWGILSVDGQISSDYREQALDIIREFIVQLCNDLIREKDLDVLRSRRRMRYAQDEQDVIDRAHHLIYHSLFAREAANRQEELERCLSVTREEIRDVAQAIFSGPEKVAILTGQS